MTLESDYGSFKVPGDLHTANDVMVAGLAEGRTSIIVDGVIHGKAGKIIRHTARTGEPIFVFRARDLLSIFPLEAYASALERFLPSDMSIQEGVVEGMNMFRRWQRDHTGQVRMPD